MFDQWSRNFFFLSRGKVLNGLKKAYKLLLFVTKTPSSFIYYFPALPKGKKFWWNAKIFVGVPPLALQQPSQMNLKFIFMGGQCLTWGAIICRIYEAVLVWFVEGSDFCLSRVFLLVLVRFSLWRGAGRRVIILWGLDAFLIFPNFLKFLS